MDSLEIIVIVLITFWFIIFLCLGCCGYLFFKGYKDKEKNVLPTTPHKKFKLELIIKDIWKPNWNSIIQSPDLQNDNKNQQHEDNKNQNVIIHINESKNRTLDVSMSKSLNNSTYSSESSLELRSNSSEFTKLSSKTLKKKTTEKRKLMTNILKINIHGTIGSDMLTLPSLYQMIQESFGTHKKLFHAILLDINSGGGEALNSDGMYYFLKEIKQKYNIPIFSYVNGICCSGALMIACAADSIYSRETTIIGSVGVISGPHFNLSGLMKLAGITQKQLSEGKGKSELDPFSEWKDEEGENLKDIMKEHYKEFVKLVCENRPNIDEKTLIEEHGARVFSTKDALKKGFIDGIMSYDEHLDFMLQKIYQKYFILKKNEVVQNIQSVCNKKSEEKLKQDKKYKVKHYYRIYHLIKKIDDKLKYLEMFDLKSKSHLESKFNSLNYFK